MDEQKPKTMIEIIKEAGYVMAVRCKDCKFGVERIDESRNPCIKCERHPIYHSLDWFCADGEMRESR